MRGKRAILVRAGSRSSNYLQERCVVIRPNMEYLAPADR
jgi:hypothetical protein